MVIIREAKEEDFSNIWPIFQNILKTDNAYAFDPDISQEEAFQIWMKKPLKTFVAEEDNTILGSYFIIANKSGAGNHVSNCGYMVDKAARGRGLASLMCEHSQNIAVEHGFKAMQFNMVISTNQAAVKLWQKLGFDIVGTVPRAFNHSDRGYVDAHIMYKWLQD